MKEIYLLTENLTISKSTKVQKRIQAILDEQKL